MTSTILITIYVLSVIFGYQATLLVPVLGALAEAKVPEYGEESRRYKLALALYALLPVLNTLLVLVVFLGLWAGQGKWGAHKFDEEAVDDEANNTRG